MSNSNIIIISFQSLTRTSAAGMGRLGFFLAQELFTRGLLKYFIVHSKGKFETLFPCVAVSFFARYYLFLLNRLNRYLRLHPGKFRHLQEIIFDKLCSLHIDDSIKVLFTTNAHMKRTFRKAKEKGIKIVYTPANPEDNYIYRLVTEEASKLELKIEDAYTYGPRLRHYNDAMRYVDEVIATYPTVHKSYLSAPIEGCITHIDGHVKPEMEAHPALPDKGKPQVFKIGYLAHTVLLKGLHYLLEAWELVLKEKTSPSLQLYIAGNLDESVRAYILKKFGRLEQVHFVGKIPDVSVFMKSLDLFVVPSLIDGGPYTALEAAHYGIPVIITENCGSGELLNHSTEGAWVVPIRDKHAIKEKILLAVNDYDKGRETGLNGKHNLDNYQTEKLIQKIANHLESVYYPKKSYRAIEV
jgi:glycosyltransferase involved in cell wall biosynthesis